MRKLIFILLATLSNLTSCQTSGYDKKIVENYTSVSILEAPFMIDELIEIYKMDTLCIKKTFNHKVFERTEYNLYCYNVCADFFKNKLLEKKNNENKEIINRIISELNYDKEINKPQINWARVFETCQTCPFGEYPDEMLFYFKFSILHMGKDEIKSMIKDEEGKQWKYVLEDIKYGDAFTLSVTENYQQYVLDRRMATYIIEKWKDSEIPEVQNLLDTYKSVM